MPIAALLAICGLSALAFWPFHAPGFGPDDWTAVLWWTADGRWIDLDGSMTGGRPLQPTAFRLLTTFGLRSVGGMYAMLWTINTFVLVAVYVFCRRVLRMGAFLATLAAALTLVYPADVTWSWLTMFAMRCSMLLGLLHIVLHHGVLTGKKAAWEIPATVCMFVSLMVYEGMAAILLAWPLLVWPWLPRKRARLLFVPAVAFATYVLLRFSVFSGGTGHRADRMTLDPLILLERLVHGGRLLVVAWLEPVERLLSVSTGQALLLAIAVPVACGSLGVLVATRRDWRNSSDGSVSSSHPARQFWAGMGLAAMGYFPMVLVAVPRLRLFDSRTNALPAIGAAIALVGLVGIVANRLAPAGGRRVVQGAAIAPLLMLGLAVQIGVRHDRAASWEQQRRIWLSVIERAPDLVPGTVVAFDVTDLPVQDGLAVNRFGVPGPLDVTEWDTTNALRFLFGRRELSGVVISPERMNESFLVDPRTRGPVDPRNLVVLRVVEAGVEVVPPGVPVLVGDTYLDLRGYDPGRRIRYGRRKYPLAAEWLAAPGLRE